MGGIKFKKSKKIKKQRECGECKVCCVTHGVPELGKSAFAFCENLAANAVVTTEQRGGCSMYGERPESCRKYECVWLQGWADDGCRPDKLGAVVEVQETLLGQVFVVKVVDALTLLSPDLSATVNHLAEDCVVWVQTPSPRTRMIVCPDRERERIQDVVLQFIGKARYGSNLAIGGTLQEAVVGLGGTYTDGEIWSLVGMGQ
tara:strand:- start:597 stop:1202 length:606 start_codon:yes stop_codon:yes gene_type:complete